MNNSDTKNYDELNEKAGIIYKFVTLYSNYIKEPHDYGTGEQIHMVEVHTLTLIADRPGITVTEVALEWNRTKGAASQIISKLEKRGLIMRKKQEGNAKTTHLYVTELGQELSDTHKKYDIDELTWALKRLKESFNDHEIDSFYRVMEKYTELVDEKHFSAKKK